MARLAGRSATLHCTSILQPRAQAVDRAANTTQPLVGGGTSGSLSLERAVEQQRRHSLLPIGLEGGSVVVGDGLVVLSGVTPLASQHTAGSFLTLGLEASSGETHLEDFPLGTLHCTRWLCCARNKLWWMTPEWGTTTRELPPEGQVGQQGARALAVGGQGFRGRGGTITWVLPPEGQAQGCRSGLVFAHSRPQGH